MIDDARGHTPLHDDDVRTLFVVNDPPYGSERAYNALRLADGLAKRDGQEVRIFLMGDAVGRALAGQVVPNGYYLDRMIATGLRHGADRVITF